MLDPLSISIPLSQPSPERPALPTRRLLQRSPDHPDDYILEMDYSAASKFMVCPRSAENYLIHSREADRDRSATDFGRLFHTLEEIRLLDGLTPATLQRQRELIALHFLQHPPPVGDHRTADMMTSVITKYNLQYKDDGWPQKVLSVDGKPMVERPFKIPLCTIPINAELPYIRSLLLVDQEPFGINEDSKLYVRNIHILYTGRIDLVIEESMVWPVDHKTSSRGGAEFEEAFRLSLQTRGYCYATQLLLGVVVPGIILNAAIIRKPTKTGKGTELLRRNYFYSQDSLVEWLGEMKDIATDIVTALVRGRFPQHALSFKSPCAGCDYSENCTLPRAQRHNDLYSPLFRDVTWNPMNE